MNQMARYEWGNLHGLPNFRERYCPYQTPHCYQGIQIVETETQCYRAVKRLKRHCRSYNVVGFECKWIKNGQVVLIQIATYKGYCVLFRVCRLGRIPSDLRFLLQNANILKVGVAPRENAKKLEESFHIPVLGALDLRYLTCVVHRPPMSLTNLAHSLLNVKLKCLCPRKSDWEANELTNEEINFAADNVLVALEIFKRLEFEYYRIYSDIHIDDYIKYYIDSNFS